ncbi:MAG: hypothetical protein JNK35_07665 [Phycisphaerae bacterium]|nr:hypothetical protein [Phycisphaerae bacterium]
MVALLAALLAPSLSSARKLGQRGKTIAALGQHSRVLAAYTNDHRDVYPYGVNPKATYSVMRCRSLGIAVPIRYFQHDATWHLPLADGYYGGTLAPSLFSSVESSARVLSLPHATFSAFFLPCTFITRPEFWSPETRLAGREQWQATRTADVLFPAKKSLLLEHTTWAVGVELGVADPPCPAAWVDGSASLAPAAIRLPQHPTGDGPDFEAYGHANALPPLMHARDGLRGRDIQ